MGHIIKQRAGRQRHKKAALCATVGLACFILLSACSGQTRGSGNSTPTNLDQTTPTGDGNGIYINMDCKDANLPRRFRKCDDEIDNHIGDRTINVEGLADLGVSASGQYSAEGLALVQREIGDKSIVIVDLRQESHGFVNGIALSWMDKDNKANKGLTPTQVTEDENSKLKALEEMGVVTFPTDGDSQVSVQSVLSERQLTEDLELFYVRLPVANNERPTDEVVDAFIQFIQSQPDDIWLHFHCMEGVGRATMFMVMYDAMKNAKTVEIEDIMDRQVLLGGKNLLHSGNKERAVFIESFYRYCKENDDGYQTSWSQWLGK